MFKNENDFADWLKDHLREDIEINLSVWLDDLETQHMNTGTNEYELAARYAADNHPHLYKYETEYLEDLEDGVIETIYIL